MLFIVFQLGADRYALEARRVVEVMPLVEIKRIPHAPPSVAGVLEYRGHLVPVVDLSELTLARPALLRFSTRILLVEIQGQEGRAHRLGLIAERAIATLRKDPAAFKDPGIRSASAPYLGPVASDPGGLVQWVEIDRLLPEPVRNVLFQPACED